MKFGIVVLVIMMVLARSACAQHQHHQTPYVGFQEREVKALSAQQIADLRAGRGMGLALPGELNGYPGPLHVLELASQLQLSAEQRQRVQQLFEAMKAEAIGVGEKLIEQERALDREFAEQNISLATLTRLTSQIGATQGQLRAVHLKYHLTTSEVLTTHQRHVYAELRGYR
jgi:hypothetical protein